ncbi:methionine aminopeptidase [Clostridia bacterium]|nr:methionine aminopeptidase [Clostridia bacterium]
MAISIKNKSQIEYMRESGRIVADTLAVLRHSLRDGITTAQLDRIAEKYIRSQGAVPSFKGYRDFPCAICTSVNEEVIHGIPGGRKLRNGDIISLDVGAFKNGYHGDAARTFPVGTLAPETDLLLKRTREGFFQSIRFAKNGRHLFEISAAIEDYVTPFGYSIVKEFVGHGVGRDMHEDPVIPHFRQKSRGPKLCAGMTLAIEPMVNIGAAKVHILRDKWTVVTDDKSLSCHYENTVLITDGDPELLTASEDNEYDCV